VVEIEFGVDAWFRGHFRKAFFSAIFFSRQSKTDDLTSESVVESHCGAAAIPSLPTEISQPAIANWD
jgi:hypothetical protein